MQRTNCRNEKRLAIEPIDDEPQYHVRLSLRKLRDSISSGPDWSRTSTPLTGTRPSTLRVCQFRHGPNNIGLSRSDLDSPSSLSFDASWSRGRGREQFFAFYITAKSARHCDCYRFNFFHSRTATVYPPWWAVRRRQVCLRLGGKPTHRVSPSSPLRLRSVRSPHSRRNRSTR